MTGEPCTDGLGSRIADVYAMVVRSSRREMPVLPDIVKNCPLGSRKLNGYLSVWISAVSTPSSVQEFVTGSNTSGLLAPSDGVTNPPTARTRPSASRVALGYQRGRSML